MFGGHSARRKSEDNQYDHREKDEVCPLTWWTRDIECSKQCIDGRAVWEQHVKDLLGAARCRRRRCSFVMIELLDETALLKRANNCEPQFQQNIITRQ